MNLAYLGHESLLHIRRDMLLLFRYNLEEAGFDVTITYNSLLKDQVNVLFGTTDVAIELWNKIKGARYIVFDTEVVTGDTVNYRESFPMKDYINFLSGAELVLTSLESNKEYWKKHGINCLVVNPGYTDRLEEIHHKQNKDIDVFFFGIVSEYRKRFLDALANRGLVVEVQGYTASPYFLRNSYIERSKIVVNLTQSAKYDHINGLRALYLAINGCCTVSERLPSITNGFDKLQFSSDNFVRDCKKIIDTGKYTEMGETFRAEAKKIKPDVSLLRKYMDNKLFFGPRYVRFA